MRRIKLMIDELAKRMGEIVLIPLFHRSFADFESMLGTCIIGGVLSSHSRRVRRDG